jgi:MoaA/NifB/PqqE/SkfB family radical SAM enzyme
VAVPASLASYAIDYGPKILTVETTSVCNLRCVMCPHSVGRVHRPKQMEYEVFDKLREQLRGAAEIQLHGIGEPLLSTTFWRFLEELDHSSAARISFNTNLTRITDKQIDTILASKVASINVSVDAARPDTYKRIRNHDFAEITANIARLIGARNARGLTRPQVLINMTLMRENIEELPDFIRLGKSLGVDEVVFWQMNEGEHWQVERDGWKFDYDAQLLKRFPEISNRMIREAMALARELGVVVPLDQNKMIFFEEAAA